MGRDMADQAKQYAGFWIRFLAWLVDSVIFSVILFLVAAAGAFLGKLGILVISVFCLLGPLLYWGLMHASARQATFGKTLLGLKVTNTSGERISLLRSLSRELAKYLSAIPLMLGFLLAAFTGRKQALHDFVASTTVVREGHANVVAALVVGTFGWFAPAAIAMFLGAGVLAGVMGVVGSGMMDQAMKGAQKQTAQSPAAQNAPATPKPAQPQAAAPSLAASGSGIDALLNTKLTGMEKPGTTRAGPVILELDNLFGTSFWIKTYLPPLDEFRGSLIVTVTRVMDAKGADLYDPGNPLEAEFFQRVSLTPQSSPIPHLGGVRTVNVKQGAKTDALQQVEGSVKLNLPVKPLTASFRAADAGKEQTLHGIGITLNSLREKEAEVRVRGDWSRLVAVIGYGADGKPVVTGMKASTGGAVNLILHGPAERIDVIVAESRVERVLPFTLTRNTVAGSPGAAAPVAVPSGPLKSSVPEIAKAAPLAGVAATSPTPASAPGSEDKPRPAEALEAVYAKFHRAGLAANYGEMKKYGTAAGAAEMAAMPARERKEILMLLALTLPKTYSITRSEISPDGKRATLLATASVSPHGGQPQTANGTIAMVNEAGAWKVENANWGGAPGDQHSPSKTATPKSPPASSAQSPSPRAPSRQVRRSEQPAQAAPPSTRPARAECVIKPVMTDEEIANCR